MWRAPGLSLSWGHAIVVPAPAEGRGCGSGVPIAAPVSRGLASDDPSMRDAIGADAAQRRAIDLQTVTQGVLNRHADLDVLREGVADLAEGFDNKLDGLCERFIMGRNYELAQECRIDDHGTLHERFEVLKSKLNDRLLEFDAQIYHLNETRAESISAKLHRMISQLQRFPDSLQHIYLGMPDWEARISTVEQNANNRIEAIRFELCRSLHDHKTKTDAFIDDLAARVRPSRNCSGSSKRHDRMCDR